MRSALLRSTPEAAWNVLPIVRFIVGPVFLFEGLQKFLYPAMRGPGRFEAMGFPAPELLGYFVGGVETVCGALILLGLFTRLAAGPLFIIMGVAIVTTKIPIWMGAGFGPFEVRELSQYGFLSMAHEMRTDWAMLLGSLMLLWAGGGRWALDRRLAPADHASGSPPSA
jgi:putative oxidoreductase